MPLSKMVCYVRSRFFNTLSLRPDWISFSLIEQYLILRCSLLSVVPTHGVKSNQPDELLKRVAYSILWWACSLQVPQITQKSPNSKQSVQGCWYATHLGLSSLGFAPTVPLDQFSLLPDVSGWERSKDLKKTCSLENAWMLQLEESNAWVQGTHAVTYGGREWEPPVGQGTSSYRGRRKELRKPRRRTWGKEQ